MDIIRTLILLLFSTFVLSSAIIDEASERSIQKFCSLQCPVQNNTSEIKNGECGSVQCYIGQCLRGCEAWKYALKSSCQDACNGTQDLLPPRELYCVMGCNFALNRYFEMLKEKFGTLSTPGLVADSLTATSLSLDWGGDLREELGEKPMYRVKWKYEDIPGSDWQYYSAQNWTTQTSIRLDNLQPYTKYRFRVVALVSQHQAAAQKIVESAPSVVIETAAQGVPASRPTRVRASAVDSTHVSVTWEPGLFPYGPVLSYVLHLTDINNVHDSYSAVKDVPATRLSYMFQNVPPGQTFNLSVSIRNWRGEGPAASTFISTPPETQGKDERMEAVLLIATHNSVVRQSSIMGDVPVTIYTSPHRIVGMALHVRYYTMFTCDSSGSISRHDGLLNPRVILNQKTLGFKPQDLSVDWLNDMLYVVGESGHSRPKWQVVRSKLDGQGLTVAVAGLYSKPLHLQIDPYNGYMFWVINGYRGRGGLYRLDLGEVSNGVRHETRPELIFEHHSLGAFTVDHANFRLLVAEQGNNTILAVSLDGKESRNYRKNTQQAMFMQVSSLVTANGLFFWTSGNDLLGEDYNVEEDNYYHATYPRIDSQNLLCVTVLLPASQPTPVPVNPPSALQAVLGHSSAKLAWQAPHLLGGQGKGAWQNWSYEIQLRNEDNGVVITKRDVSSTSLTISPLNPDTSYSIKACAYTSAGRGPWSAEFRGRSFRATLPGYQEASLVWGASEGLMRSDTTGDSVETLIHADSLKDGSEPVQIAGVAWYEDTLYLATNASRTLRFNLTSRAQSYVPGVDSAGSIAVDWLGRRLYWSNPKQQLITRGGLNGEDQEPLPILTVAKELHIDSLNAFLYWSTGHAVECARLNGQHRYTYYPAQLFTGKQVMGLTLDSERGLVFWIVRSYEGSLLYRAPMALDSQPIPVKTATPDTTTTRVISLMHPVVQGPLCYYSDHLLWLQDSTNAVISDLTGQGAAVISGSGLSGINVVAVVEPAIHAQPSSVGKAVVIPSTVPYESLRLVGLWDSFNVTWQPVTNVNFGRVFYQLKFREENLQKEITVETDETWIEYPRVLAPYSKLEVSVRAFTYWGSSRVTMQAPVILHTPAATPSAPAAPRTYVSYLRNSPIIETGDIRVQFRWDPPLKANGIVEEYRVEVCLNGIDKCTQFILDPLKLEFTSTHLQSYTTYSFQVWARTVAGEGPGSEIVWADTSFESPVPRLLIGTKETLSLTDCDRLVGRASEIVTTVVRSEPLPTVSYLATDRRLYWLSQDRVDIYSSLLDGTSTYKVISLNGTGTSLAVDWIARVLYWSEQSNDHSSASIWKYELEQNKLSRVLARPVSISVIQISPLTSSLFWVEEMIKGEGQLYTSQLDGSQVKPFFSSDSSCSCPANPIVTNALSLDSSKEIIQLLWSDKETGEISAAKLDGCKCDVIVNATVYSGVPANALTSDRDLVYWSGGKEGKVHSASMAPVLNAGSRGGEMAAAMVSPEVAALNLTGVKLLVALGTHLQPFPEPDCLGPVSRSDVVPLLLSHTSHSLTLKLPSDSPPRDELLCKGVSMPSPRYHLYFASQSCDLKQGEITKCNPESLGNCSHLETYESEVELRDLAPFSCYVVMMAIGNYYTDFTSQYPYVSEPVVFQTQAGAPSEARNVSVRLLSPWSVRVSWLPPEQLRGSTLRYEVHWSTEDVEADQAGARQRGEQPVTSEVLPTGEYATILDKLIPAHTYLIWVRANSEGSSHEFSESEQVEVHTLPEPHDIGLYSATPYSLNITWEHNAVGTEDANIESHVQMQQVLGKGSLSVWHDVKETFPGSTIYHIKELTPKTLYQFRVNLRYPGALQQFTWPPDNRFTFETLGDKPSTPGTPHIQHVRQNVYQVSWEPSKEHGAPIEVYYLEGKVIGPGTMSPRSSREAPSDVSSTEAPEENLEDWHLLYNGTETFWIISTELSSGEAYSFRACARNMYGLSSWSAASEVFDWSGAALLGYNPDLGLILATGVPAIAFALIFIATLYFCRVRRAEEKRIPVTQRLSNQPDVELATLHEVPRGRNGMPLMQHNNILYTGTNGAANGDVSAVDLTLTDQDVAALPHISRDQIKLTKFLGSGAFGKVHEGTAHNLPGGQQKVAVKTLREGATEQEKAEFLKEAQLMSNFKHEHILQLLGVCLDIDPNFIIMELMEGGDLLSHLRASRPLAISGDLTLLDLVAMSVDVARGCRYLEEMHFVHRDLACRNCLVSFDGGVRVVKIGDFGLARDIYKNDYYRKEGEGLLPVRWMAPESLVDGVFTSLSDAWAFGVLVWEVLTMGQQPYPARSNLEVLHFVRAGGRLNRPFNCPDPIYHMLLKCWSYCPEGRPTFKYCLEVLANLKIEIEQDPNPVPIVGHFVGHPRSGLDNAGFYADEFYSGDSSMKSDDVIETFDETFQPGTVSLPPETEERELPKYLEVMMEPLNGEESAESAYETPRKFPASWAQCRPRASSAGCDDLPSSRYINRTASAERLLNITKSVVPYSNILSSSQPLLRDASDSSGFSSQVESGASGEMSTN